MGATGCEGVIGQDSRAETTQGENMPRLECPKCKEELDEIIRSIEVRCRYDEEDDDYLNETGGDRFVDLCPKCKTELATF